ncbi:MAG: ArsR/SmtB family transcription factor [Anaerolineae bacterium]
MRQDKVMALLRALADPTRLSIFELLMEGTHCNCEMGERLGLPANLISHHLKVLREVGLVSTERHPTDARWVYYSIDKQALAEARAELAALLDPYRLRTRCPGSCQPANVEMVAAAVANE